MISVLKQHLPAMQARLGEQRFAELLKSALESGQSIVVDSNLYFKLLKESQESPIVRVIGADAQRVNRAVQGVDLKQGMRGIGDLIGAIATPIARALGMDCIDKSSGQLKDSSPCAKRKAAMNAAIPFGKRD